MWLRPASNFKRIKFHLCAHFPRVVISFSLKLFQTLLQVGIYYKNFFRVRTLSYKKITNWLFYSTKLYCGFYNNWTIPWEIFWVYVFFTFLKNREGFRLLSFGEQTSKEFSYLKINLKGFAWLFFHRHAQPPDPK